jgi:hypothetical protein
VLQNVCKPQSFSQLLSLHKQNRTEKKGWQKSNSAKVDDFSCSATFVGIDYEWILLELFSAIA